MRGLQIILLKSIRGNQMALDHKDLSKILEVAIVAARLAGQRAMEEISYTKSSVKMTAKSLPTPINIARKSLSIE